MSLDVEDDFRAGHVLSIDKTAPRSVGPFGRRHLALLNLMPTKQETERQFRNLLNSTQHHVDITLLTTETYRSKHANAADLFHYSTLSQIRDQRFDGLIITGAPVEKLPFEEVRYWSELLEIFAWAQQAVPKRFYICWAAQAALYARYGIGKLSLPSKLFGVYAQQVLKPHSALLSGFPGNFSTPVSRYTTLDNDALHRQAGLEILAATKEGEICLVGSSDHADTYMLNHLEYDANSLALEFERDRDRGLLTALPANYFPDNNPTLPPINNWQASARRLFGNWLALRPASKRSFRADNTLMPLNLENTVHDEACLLTPGPLALSAFVKEGMLYDVGSRDAYFKTITREIRTRILSLANGASSHTVIPIQGSGTFAVEAALTTFIGPQDKALVLVNGLYGERIASILRRNELDFEVRTDPITQPPNVGEVAARLEADASITHLCFVHCETTSGILNPYAELVRCARDRGVITIVDSMSAFGAIPIDLEEDPADIILSSANKCLEAPPGLAFAIVATAMLNRKSARARSFTLDLYDQWRAFEEIGEWRSTPPTHVALALHRALTDLIAEGIEGRRARYEKVRDRLIEGLEPLGFKPILSRDLQSPICVAFQSDQGVVDDQISFQKLYNHLAAEHLYIYAKIHAPTGSFRIGCIGQIQEAWIERLIESVGDFVSKLTPYQAPSEASLRSFHAFPGAA